MGVVACRVTLNVLGEGSHGDGALRQRRLKKALPILRKMGPGLDVILGSREELPGVGAGIRPLHVPGEVAGARQLARRIGG